MISDDGVVMITFRISVTFILILGEEQPGKKVPYHIYYILWG